MLIHVVSLMYCWYTHCRCYNSSCCSEFTYHKHQHQHSTTFILYTIILIAQHSPRSEIQIVWFAQFLSQTHWWFDWLCDSPRGRRWWMCTSSRTDGKCKIWPFKRRLAPDMKMSLRITNRGWWVQRSPYMILHIDLSVCVCVVWFVCYVCVRRRN